SAARRVCREFVSYFGHPPPAPACGFPKRTAAAIAAILSQQPRHASVAAAAGPNEFASFQPARGWLRPVAAASAAARRGCGGGPGGGATPATRWCRRLATTPR